MKSLLKKEVVVDGNHDEISAWPRSSREKSLVECASSGPIVHIKQFLSNSVLTGDTRKIFVSNIKTVDESHSARVLIGCKPINFSPQQLYSNLNYT